MTTGKIRLTGQVLAQAQCALATPKLQVYRVSLAAAAVYRTITSLDELQRSGGFVLLAEAESDRGGKYTIALDGNDASGAKRKTGNLVVYAVDGRDIVGRSGMIVADDYASTGEARKVDVIVTRAVDARPEYDKVVGRLKPFLEQNKVGLRALALSRDQTAFAARELGEDEAKIRAVAEAESLTGNHLEKLSPELLYALARQGVPLTWATLYRQKDAELRAAMQQAVEAKVIGAQQERDITALLKSVQATTAQWMLDYKPRNHASLDTVLSYARLDRAQRLAFVGAIRSFDGNYEDFWKTYLPNDVAFRGKPELIKSLLLTQQLVLLAGGHTPLVEELQVKRKVTDVTELLALSATEWEGILRRVGVPPAVEGTTNVKQFANAVESCLQAAYPTQTVALMAKRGELPLGTAEVRAGVEKFLASSSTFDIASSRIHELDGEIKAAAPKQHQQVKSELLRMQRVFQVSPNPQVMVKLMERQLNSAAAISGFAEKSFVKIYGDELGGAAVASAVHQRATYINTRAEHTAAGMVPYLQSQPQAEYALPAGEKQEAQEVLQQYLPNYSELFGRPDLCECPHCRSVYSPAAYFVDLMRFLWRSVSQSSPTSALEIFKQRRPDLFHLPLTCENTNTLIPYIDVANEVMEYYAVHGKLDPQAAHDTGEVTADELRASPQYINAQAYKILAAAEPAPDGTSAVYPFKLPYHRPLDIMRTYAKQLGTSRHEIMTALRNDASPATTRAIEAESLALSPDEYRIITRRTLTDLPDTRSLPEYYGYASVAELDKLKSVTEFLSRSGITYTELVDLVKTRFVNPHQHTLVFAQSVFAASGLAAEDFYNYLGKLKAGTISATERAAIESALAAYDAKTSETLDYAQFSAWVDGHLAELQSVITLYQTASLSDLASTELRTMRAVYDAGTESGISADTWSKMHRFLRLWRKLGCTMQELDLSLYALGESDITPEAVSKLSSLVALQTRSKRPINLLATLWGDIDTFGDRSLYKKLFLNKAVQRIDDVFKPDELGNYLLQSTEKLASHAPAIRAAFGLSDDDFGAILASAMVVENGTTRLIVVETDTVSLGVLSTIYRYVVLSKALKLRVAELCLLMEMLKAQPFSRWDVSQSRYVDISPVDTLQFYDLAMAAKNAGFKPATLQYIFAGTTTLDTKMALDSNKVLLAAKSIREAFLTIEREHSAVPPSPLTLEAVRDKLSLSYKADLVQQLLAVIEGTASLSTVSEANLEVSVPAELAAKYAYVKATGLLTCGGVMSDAERAALKALPNAGASFSVAVDALYKMPDDLLFGPYGGIFDDPSVARATLLCRPLPQEPSSLEDRLRFVYARYLPLLKDRLRQDAVINRLAALLGLSDEAAAILVHDDLDTLMQALSWCGHGATYFSDAAFGTIALQRVDAEIDFAWTAAAPIPAGARSVRWQSWVVPPASGDYTLIVDVARDEESFSLYLDGLVVLHKEPGDVRLSWEAPASLNAAAMHHLRLDYVVASGDGKVRLSWRTATTAAESIPASTAYPVRELEEQLIAKMGVCHRAAKVISAFGLDERELDHFSRLGCNFGDLSFKALTPEHWQRLQAYVALREAVPQAQATLIDVFVEAQTDTATADSLKEVLSLATAWERKNLDYLVDTHFSLTSESFKSEVELNRLHTVLKLARKTGVSSAKLAAWAAPHTSYDDLAETAGDLQDAVKAKYEDADWLQVAGGLSDTVREHQQQALIGHLLTRAELRDARGIRDADGLFEYFLIDVQMGTRMDSSRIVLASSAIQLFVARCLLNLEQEVSPEAINTARWEWMKNYRVWEANRKVFLYPENWIEPEWRDNKSELFAALESELTQNDITDRSVETAFRNYLSKLAAVANLDVCGLYQETAAAGDIQTQPLHVFARTRNAPHQYYYRVCDRYKKWSAWEKVPLEIRGVDDGTTSGVHLIPVVWKKRLFLFWPELLEKQSAPDIADPIDTTKPVDLGGFRPAKYWEIHLSWSEYVDGKWSSKQMTNEHLDVFPWGNEPVPANLSFQTSISQTTGQLVFVLRRPLYDNLGVMTGFVLSDIAAAVDSFELNLGVFGQPEGHGYANHFMKQAGSVPLSAKSAKLLTTAIGHTLLYSSQAQEQVFAPTLTQPFFFADKTHTYFVQPTWQRLPRMVAIPQCCRPVVVDIVEADVASDLLASAPLGFDALVSTTGVSAVCGSAVSSPVSTRSHGNAKANSSQTSTSIMTEVMNIPAAFGGSEQPGLDIHFHELLRTRGAEIDTFYHPFTSSFVSNLNLAGLDGLMQSDTSLPDDNGLSFEKRYVPTARVKRPSLPPVAGARTYYKENVCFDVYGANSIYNWELFFHAPLYIATRLSKNGKYAEAMKWFHFIFDPTTDEEPQGGRARYWQVPPFKITEAKRLEDWFLGLLPNADRAHEEADIAEWRDNPFRPHVVARNRPIAYMKHVVLKYVDNLVSWGDELFRRDTWESINEALQLYVTANHILGPRPEVIPERSKIKAETYASLAPKLDDFSNALMQLENLFPYSSEVPESASDYSGSLLGAGLGLYFGIPSNDKLLEHWDTVADRLYKIRHCMNIDGVERSLALFEPPIDPGMLVKAVAQGLSLGSLLSDLSTPPPVYRFTYLLQKANEFCAEVRSLGSALLSVLEKKDGEELGRLRATHETVMLELMTAVKERQVLDARVNRESLAKSRETAELRLQHYLALLGNDSVTVPAATTIDAALTAESALPADTSIAHVAMDVDESLVGSDVSGLKLLRKEQLEIDKLDDAHVNADIAGGIELGTSAVLALIPNADADGKPLGVGAGVTWGGSNLSSAASAIAKYFQLIASDDSQKAGMAAKMASYIRREQDWTLQTNLAAREIVQLDKQITAADIRVQVATKELENHKTQIEQAHEVEQFLEGKFTNQELYQWMKEQTFAIYKQSYNMAYSMAKKAEKAYRYELGDDMASFVEYGYWDNSQQGLMAGERLQLALRQMDKSYIEDNKRELELTKNVSLAQWSPLALQQLKETGACYVTLREELFDLDFQGHYFRRVKSVRLSIPCVAGPYTTLGCTLRLLKNTVRTKTSMSSEGAYEHNNDAGVPTDDERFRSNNVVVKSVATSTGQSDAGVFELNFRDERYLPFEGAGVISEWKIELTRDADLRQFDYATLTDVVMHISYTAREDSGSFKEQCVSHLKSYLQNDDEQSDQPLLRLFSLKHEFPSEWHRFLHPGTASGEQVLRMTIGKDRMPWLARHRGVVVMRVDLLARTTLGANEPGEYTAVLSATDSESNELTSGELSMPTNASYGGVRMTSLVSGSATIDLESIDIDKPLSVWLKRSSASDYASLPTDPDEVKDLLLLLHYKLDEND